MSELEVDVQRIQPVTLTLSKHHWISDYEIDITTVVCGLSGGKEMEGG